MRARTKPDIREQVSVRHSFEHAQVSMAKLYSLMSSVLRSLEAHSSHSLQPPCPGLHRRSGEERPGTCACAALREHELLVPVIAALVAPSWKRSATCAGREPLGRIEGMERPQALAKAKAALVAVGKAKAMGKTLDRKDTFAEKASPQKNRLSATGTRSTEWRASTWVA